VHMTARDRDGMRKNNRKFMSCPWVIDMPALCSLTPRLTGAGGRRLEDTKSAAFGVRVEPPVRLGREGTILKLHFGLASP